MMWDVKLKSLTYRTSDHRLGCFNSSTAELMVVDPPQMKLIHARMQLFFVGVPQVYGAGAVVAST